MEIKIDNYSKKFRSDYVLRNITILLPVAEYMGYTVKTVPEKQC